MSYIKRFSILLVALISSFLFCSRASAYVVATTRPLENTFTINPLTNYKIIHQLMDINGQSYTDVKIENKSALMGTMVTPEPMTGAEVEHFITPQIVPIKIDVYNKVITIKYERKKYLLTVNNSANVTSDSTSSGEYYYESPIHLKAKEKNEFGADFVKWSDDYTERDYSFVMTGDKTIEPVYGDPYVISFVTNVEGVTLPDIERYGTQALGTLPTVRNDDCESSTGSYASRNCTYVYEFKGWYLESTFEHEVNEQYVPTSDITLYARWNKIYFHNDSTTFDGSELLDTQIKLFNKENADKDFIVTFTIDTIDSGQIYRATMFANMDERAEPYPGVVFRRYDNDNVKKAIVANVEIGKKRTAQISNYVVGNQIIYKRTNNILSVSIDGGETFVDYNDFTGFNRYFEYNATFGGEYDANGSPYRLFKGTMSDMTIELIERSSYTVKFDANGGSGMMLNQNIHVNESSELNKNEFTRQGYMFSSWNTKADGSGTTYADKASVLDLAQAGEVVTLYAQWESAPHYFVAYNANGGVGSMSNQEFVYGIPQELEPVVFTKENYAFKCWNTESDGSGDSYKDKEVILSLTQTDGEVVTLYAQYERVKYVHNGAITFDGTNNIDTGINVYSVGNINRDYDISFDVTYIDPQNATSGQELPTIINVKDEFNTTAGAIVPGYVLRLEVNNMGSILMTSNWNGQSVKKNIPATNLPVHFEFKRRDGIVTVKYSYDSYESDEMVLINQNLWNYDKDVPISVIFGSTEINEEYTRFFMGTLENINVEVYTND